MKTINLILNLLSKSVLILFAVLFLTSSLSAQHCTCNTSGLTTWGSNSSSTTNLSTHYPSGIIGSTCIKVWGTLYIDVNASWTNVDLFMQPGATIVVNASKSLTLTTSRLSGCSAMWSGVTLLSGSSISMYSSSLIRDAVDAINSNSVTAYATVDHSDLTHNNNCIVMTGAMTVNLDNATLAEGSGGPISGTAAKGVDLDNLSSGTLNIVNSTFDLISDPVNCETGSGAIDIQASTINGDGVTGLGISVNDVTGYHYIAYNVIDNAQSGMELIDISADIEGNNITNMLTFGINFIGPKYSTCFIDDNILADINGTAIQVSELISTITVYVRRNDISTYDGQGIQLANSTLGPVSCFVLNNNIYSNNSGGGSSTDTGIRLRNIRAATVNENVVNTQGADARGIALENAHNCTLTLNVANGAAQTDGDGITTNISPGNTFTCNYTDNSLRGFRSSNICGATNLLRNTFNDHFTGLQVEAGSYIGQQLNNWNRWSGTYGSSLGAENLNSLMVDVVASEFVVGTPLFTIYHPNNSLNGFFLYTAATPPSDEQCYIEQDPEYGRQALVQIIGGISGNGAQAKSNNWEGKRYVYGQLLDHPEYLIENEILAEFFSNQAGTDIERFHLANAAIIEGNFQEANSLLQEITPNDVFDQNLKDVYGLAAMANISYNQAQIELLTSVAEQCPSTGGSGVFVARSLYNRYVDAKQQFSDDCESIEDRNASKFAQSGIASIAPNPALDFVRVSIREPKGEKNMVLIDALGKIVEQIKVVPFVRQVDIQLSKYQSGIYYIEIFGDNVDREVHKLVVIK